MGTGSISIDWCTNRLTLTLVASILVAGCAAPEKVASPSPVADPMAPMRVSAARVTTAAPDPVGQLFNDGPRQVVAYSSNTDPLSVLFRDPAFVVNLSPPTETQRIEVLATPTRQATEPVTRTVTVQPPKSTRLAESSPTVAPASAAEPVATALPVQQEPPRMAAAVKPTTEPSAPVTTAPVTTAQASTDVTSATNGVTGSETSSTTPVVATPVAVAAATAVATTNQPPAKAALREPPLSNEPVTLDGLRQKAAGWPVSTRPSNVFGARGPDGTAWRGLVYKSPAKTPVKAIDPGRVVFAQSLRGYGNVIIVDHGKQYTSIYGYNDALTKQVGELVRKGETIALVGDTGPLADEALYFEIRKAGVPINPSLYLAANP